MKKTFLTIAGSIIAGAVAGFLIGRQNVFIEKTEYKKLPQVAGIITLPEPVGETTPENPVLPVRVDTFYRNKIKYVTQTVDTAAIIDDYVKKRSYEMVAFEDEKIGKLEVKTDVQYNSLASLEYLFTPVQKITTIEKKRVWMPFVAASYSSLGSVGVGAGMFYHNVGVEYQFTFSLNENECGHWVGVMWRF